MPKTMKAAVVREFRKPLVIEEVAIPEPGPGQIQVKIEASGVCHTDLHAAEGDWPVKPKPPFIPGHEGVGFVSGVGSGVTQVKEGDRVGVPWLYTACGHCEHCLGGWETLCEAQQNTGYSVNGGFADYVVADPNYVGHLPANIDFIEIAPVLCAGVTVYKGLKVTDTKPGNWVVISGIGGLGHMAVQYAREMGLNVAAVDIDDEQARLGQAPWRDGSGQCQVDRSGVLPEEGDRRRPRRAGHGRFSESLRASARHGPTGRHHLAQWIAAWKLSAADLRHGAERHHGAGLDRWHPARPAGGT